MNGLWAQGAWLMLGEASSYPGDPHAQPRGRTLQGEGRALPAVLGTRSGSGWAAEDNVPHPHVTLPSLTLWSSRPEAGARGRARARGVEAGESAEQGRFVRSWEVTRWRLNGRGRMAGSALTQGRVIQTLLQLPRALGSSRGRGPAGAGRSPGWAGAPYLAVLWGGPSLGEVRSPWVSSGSTASVFTPVKDKVVQWTGQQWGTVDWAGLCPVKGHLRAQKDSMGVSLPGTRPAPVQSPALLRDLPHGALGTVWVPG